MRGVLVFTVFLLTLSSVFAASLPSELDKAIDSMSDVSDAEKEYYKQAVAEFLSSKTQEYANDYLIKIAESSSYTYTEVGGKVLKKLSIAKDVVEWYKAYDDYNKNPSAENDILLSEAAMSFYSNFFGPAGLLIDGMITIMKGERERISNLNELHRIIDDALASNEDKLNSFSNGKNLIEDATDQQLIWYLFKDYSDTSNIYDLETPRWGLLKYMSDERIDSLTSYMQSHPESGINAYNSPVTLKYFRGLGTGVITKHSPVYLLITDPLGNKYGVNPDDKGLLCTDESICTDLVNASDPEVIILPSLVTGVYNIKVYGFNDGEFTFTFKGFTYSADNQFIRVFNSPILKGEVLEANLTLVNTSNGFRESFSNFTRSGFFTVGVNPELMPFKLLSVEPANDSLVIAGKPVIKLFFNKPLNTSQSFGFLGSGVTSFEDGNKTLIFFPLEPLSSGVKRVNLSGITDLHGLKLLDNTSSVFRFLSTYSSGLKYSLSNPLVFNASRSFYFRNNNSNAVRLSIDMALIDSKLPSMYSVINGYSLEPSGFNVDSFGNHRAYWNLNLNPGERVDLVINYTFLLLSVNYFDFINVSAIGNSVASDYSVLSWAGLQVSDELISSLSNRLSSKDDSDFIKALRVYDWVRGNINYDYSGTYPNDAISVLVNRTGVCEGYSNIYTALTRSLGLPTRFIFGYTLSGTDGSDSSGHTWAEVYVSNIGWLPVDPTWGRSVNDWFLNTDSSHALALTMPGWPVSGTDWFNYDTGSAYDYSSYVFNYTLVNSDSLWSTEVNDVYNAVRALDFKKRVLNFPFYDGLLVDGSHYVFTRKYYDSDLSALGTDYLLVQSGNYSTVTASVYSELIGLFSSLLDDYYTELSSAYSNCSSCVNFTSYIDASSGKSLGFLFSSVNNSLANSTVLLNAGDFDSLINELGSVMVSLERGINWNRVYLLNDYLFSDYRLANDLVVSDLFISNYVANEASVSNDLSPVELFYSVVIVLLMFVFAPVSWFICLIRGGKSHGRVFWLLVIFFFNFIGAIWYWVKEH